MDVTLGRWTLRGDAADSTAASLGRPTWGPAALLADLELRLGLPGTEADERDRLSALGDAARALAARTPEPFYARSLRVDGPGTERQLLAMRDLLVEAGWTGTQLPGAGPRLDALAALEASCAHAPGRADRLAAVAHALAAWPRRTHDRIALLESRAVWPGAWRTIFERLAARGTVVEAATLDLPGADPSSDLGRAQAVLRGGASSLRAAPAAVLVEEPLRGDGSLVLLRASTSWELGEATAALLAARALPPRAASAVVVRAGDASPLDVALVAQGLRSQGVTSSSALRPIGQVLPLALGLLFAPRDVQHVLELLSLPVSPIPWPHRGALLDALGRASGVGNPGWRAKVEAMPDDIQARVAAWIEPGAFARDVGAPRADILAVVDRVRSWALARRAMKETRDAQRPFDPLLAATASVRSLVERDPRERLRAHEIDLLIAACAPASEARHSIEAPGRVGHVGSPFDLLRARGVVVLWHAGAAAESAPFEPFRVAERKALAAAGVVLPEPEVILAERAGAWRRAVLAATGCLIVATPDAHLGAAQGVLPVWDEIVAGLHLQPRHLDALTVTAGSLRQLEASAATAHQVVATAVEPLPLPPPRLEWTANEPATAALLAASARLSATSADALLGCPLRFGFDAARLRPARVAMLGEGSRLLGTIGHRLIEELHLARAIDGASELDRERASVILDRLIEQEAGPLLAAGRGVELAHARANLLGAAEGLAAVLRDEQLEIEGVEMRLETPGGEVVLHGRLDVLLRDRHGAPFILDLKWGRSVQEKKLEGGTALQLAHYAEVVRRLRGLASVPPAAYFVLNGARLLAVRGTPVARATLVDGPSIATTASGMTRATRGARALLARGRLPATGVGPVPRELARVLDDADAVTRPAGDACSYCGHAPLCGRAWEALS